VTALVRRLGGVTAAAHLKDRGGHGALEALQRLGVDGVEARHPSHDAATTARIEGAAAALDMVLTGGSDWHGDTHELDPYRAPLGGVDIPPVWLERLEQWHHDRASAEVIS
jgi:hypothetical protein